MLKEAARMILSLCVVVLFLSILTDFALYSRKDNVHKEKKSIVETGTMTFFFLIYYLILRSGIGRIPVPAGAGALLTFFGTVMVAAGCGMNIYGRFNLGRNWANHIKIYEEHKLVMAGMYRIVRHPLYGSIMLMFYGGCLVYVNWISFAAVTFIFIPFMYYRAKQEETLLLQSFPEYSAYRRQTGMFFPRFFRKE